MTPWTSNAHRAELLALYAEVDSLVGDWSCACATAEQPRPRCCQFDVTGREPYPTAVELAEVRHALRAHGAPPARSRTLPLAPRGPCPLLARDGGCRIYEARPFGCRTFFCPDDAEGPGRFPRDGVRAIGRRIADLSSRFDPRDPHPRPLVRALRRP